MIVLKQPITYNKSRKTGKEAIQKLDTLNDERNNSTLHFQRRKD